MVISLALVQGEDVQAWETGRKRRWKDTLRQRDCGKGVMCHLIKLGLILGTTGDQGVFKQGNDAVTFYLEREEL